jgi:membrane associated rhomboid family serine protease
VEERPELPADPEDEDEDGGALVAPVHPGWERFPWSPVLAVAALIALHLALTLPGNSLWRRAALLRGVTREEPWRLLTSLFLHSDAAHVLWNGASMLVFAVPLLIELGYASTALVYLTAGAGGALTALAFASPGTMILGSSGAVAGLFGAWVVLTLRRSAEHVLSWRSRIRTLGVALLVLPSLLSPITRSGKPISVSSHLGGLATGMLIGAVISSRLVSREMRAPSGDVS